jgi:hypothetical protein
MRPPLAILLLTLTLSFTTASAQTWGGVSLGQSRDAIQTQFTDANLQVSSLTDGDLQTNTAQPISLPGLLYPLPMMATFHFDAKARLAEVTLSLDLPAMRRDYAALGSDEALFNFAAEKLAFVLAGEYGTPAFSTPSCNAETTTAPCTLQWNQPPARQVIELERIPSGHHLRIRYLPSSAPL